MPDAKDRTRPVSHIKKPTGGIKHDLLLSHVAFGVPQLWPRTLMRANGNSRFNLLSLSFATQYPFPFLPPLHVPQNDKRTTPVFKITRTHKT